MSITDSTIPCTKILPLIYSNGEYVTQGDVFSDDTLYEVISGQHCGRRGTKAELEKLCGSCVDADWVSAISCETGAILRRGKDSFLPARDFVL